MCGKSLLWTEATGEAGTTLKQRGISAVAELAASNKKVLSNECLQT